MAASNGMPSWARVAAMSETAVWMRRLLLSRSLGTSSGFVGVRREAQRGAGLLDRGPGLLDLLAGDVERVVPLVELGLGGRALAGRGCRSAAGRPRPASGSTRCARSVATWAFSEATCLRSCSCGFFRRNQLPRAAASCDLDLGLRQLEVRPRLLTSRLRLGDGHLERLAVEPDQEHAGLDAVVLVDEDFGHEPVDPRADVGDVPRHEGVVGRFGRQRRVDRRAGRSRGPGRRSPRR